LPEMERSQSMDGHDGTRNAKGLLMDGVGERVFAAVS